jgi:hypothetical protein
VTIDLFNPLDPTKQPGIPGNGSLIFPPRGLPDDLRVALTAPRLAFDQTGLMLQTEVRALCERYPLMSLDRAALIARRRLRLPPPSEVTITVKMTR